jgi:hypothetical protein
VQLQSRVNLTETQSAQADFAPSIAELMTLVDSPIARGWFRIDDDQTVTWQAINNTQSITWSNIGDDQSPNWVEIDNSQY